MKISFEGITLRPWVMSDAEGLAVICNNKKIADNLRDGFPNPYSLADAEKWLDMFIPGNVPVRFFAIEINNVLSGSIGLVQKDDIYRKNFEVGYFLAEAHWGKGIMTKAIKAATTYAFTNFDIIRVYAEPFADNKGSKRALEKAGYILEAVMRKNVIKNDIIKDSCIYSILREEWVEKYRR